MLKNKQELLERQTYIESWFNQVSDYIDSPDFLNINNKAQHLVMEQYNMLCAQRLLIIDLIKLYSV